jgi:RES domain-containing protein
VPPKYSSTAFSGEGAFINGGRWNSPGVRVVYTTSSIALAVLEVLAYRKAKKPLTPRHLYSVMLEETQVRWLRPDELPADWNSYPHSESTQQLGDAWVRAGETVGLAVPSALAPPEVNVMLNAQHPDFSSLAIEGPELFPINLRLVPD